MKACDIRRPREDPAKRREQKAAKVFAAMIQQLIQHDRVGPRGGAGTHDARNKEPDPFPF
jgi:hypothetical protein